jgi:hypothetical protein
LFIGHAGGAAGAGRKEAPVPKRASDEVLLVGILLARIERWLEQEDVFHVAGFGDVTLAGELDWEPGAGPVYLRRIADGPRRARPVTARGQIAPACPAAGPGGRT